MIKWLQRSVSDFVAGHPAHLRIQTENRVMHDVIEHLKKRNQELDEENGMLRDRLRLKQGKK